MAVDYSDPCAVLPLLREAYFKLAIGGSVTSIQFADRRVTYEAGNMAMLRAEISRLEIACAQQQGKAASRFAIAAGGGRGRRSL